MTSGSRFKLNSLALIALIFGLAFSVLGTPAQAGLFGRCGGGGLFGRRANVSACSSGYAAHSYQYQVTSPCGSAGCGQATAGYQYQSYQYQAAPAAPCAPCGQTTIPMPTYAPAQPLPGAPTIQSAPVGLRAGPVPRLSCADGSCRLR